MTKFRTPDTTDCVVLGQSDTRLYPTHNIGERKGKHPLTLKRIQQQSQANSEYQIKSFQL